ncbi:MAG: acetoin utilization protein AcuC [Desulfarculaceae bacterium]|jgi:acetoin utilization protein AcuC
MPHPLPPPEPAYLYTESYLDFDYGPSHPLRIARLGLTHLLIELCGLAQTPFTVTPATLDQLAHFHDRRYLDTLQKVSLNPDLPALGSYGLGPGDNPVFKGVFEWSALLTGASLQAVDLVAQAGHTVAFSMAGGMHHAMAGRASGFCYVNDPVLAILKLTDLGHRVAYVDLDAHHGDGVQWAFYRSNQVLTISLHQHPATLFPGTGYIEEMGHGEARGYSVNVPLWPDTDDEIYTQCFEELVPPLLEAFAPDYVVTQLGVDTLLEDPLANLNLTTTGFGHCVRSLKKIAADRWIALGGGGYDLANVARCWTLAWAIMQGREDQLPRELPPEFCAKANLSPDKKRLLDPQEKLRGRGWPRAQEDAKDVIAYIKREIFPILEAG